jgi:uncharacterized protein (TIGR02145 family)
MFTALGGESIAGGKMKEAGIAHWQSPNTDADNSSGFTSLPAGVRSWVDGVFSSIGYSTAYWASNDSGGNGMRKALLNDSAGITGGYVSPKWGLSVRCVRDLA